MKKAIALVLLGAAGAVFAANVEDHVSARTAEDFTAEAEHIRNEMRQDGRYGGISPRDREKVETELTRMEQLLARHGSVDEMGPRERSDLFNAQERANGLLTGNDDQRQVCQMVESTGSKMRQRQCRRLGDIRRTRDAHRDGLRNQTRSIMNSGNQL